MRYSLTVHYADRLQERISKTSPVCVGLDPVLEKLPEGVSRSVEGIAQFCYGICDAVAGIASCVKVNIAFFEAHGWQGVRSFWDVCGYAHKKGLIVIADAKRGDIGSTAQAYADGYLGKDSPVDALTVNPYLGSDGVVPFTELCAKNNKGIYVLVKTSNKSSGELQDLAVGDESVHEHLAQLVESWAAGSLGKATSLSSVGAVVGATYPEELKYLRTLMPHCPLLIPGYGAQGGTAADCKHGFLPNGSGAIVNASRSIIYASNGENWKEAATKAAEMMARELALVIAR